MMAPSTPQKSLRRKVSSTVARQDGTGNPPSRKTTEDTAQEHEPLVAVKLVGVERGGVRRVTGGTEHEGPAVSYTVDNRRGKEAGDNHETEDEGVGSVDEVRRLSSTSA